MTVQTLPNAIDRADERAPILVAVTGDTIHIRAGTVIRLLEKAHAFEHDTPIAIETPLTPGHDYGVGIDDAGQPFVAPLDERNPLSAGYFAGFHFAPGANATANSGGSDTPAINAYSIWDIGFRPACADPRGMTLVEANGRLVWVDIYLLAMDHASGTSQYGVQFATGKDLPERYGANGRYGRLDYSTAVEILGHHGKRLLGAEEFFAAAFGVQERCARSDKPKSTGSMKDGGTRFISRHGLFDATGTVWQWGTDGHPLDPRPSVFGGSWFSGGGAGSRYASLDYWPGLSHEDLGARGACDHLKPE